MKVISNILILCFSIFNAVIGGRTIIRIMGYYLDESGLSPHHVYGSDLLSLAQWLALLFNVLVGCLALYNLYAIYNKESF